MKKTLLSTLIISILLLGNGVAFSQNPPANNPAGQEHTNKQKMKKQFEQRLNLTEAQKAKAAEIHKQGREEIKPLMMQISVKQQEIETVKLSRISEQMQQERIAELNAEIKELQKQAREIRKKNTQEFEKILDKKQKAEFEQMKAEGRMKFEQSHPARPPFGGLGTPSFLLRPQIAPPTNGVWK